MYSMEGKERRNSLRIPVTAKVKFVEGNMSGYYFTENLSIGGFQLDIKKPPAIGSNFSVELSLPETNKLIKAICVIMWREEGKGCGAKFEQISSDDVESLIQFLDTIK